MEHSLVMQAVLAVPTVRPFLSNTQLLVMSHAGGGEEGPFFLQKFIDLAQQIAAMPKTYEQEDKGDQATAHLHYFVGGCDWYITEKDVDGGVQQAYGYAIINGDDEMAECGYICIEEITRCGAELDLHFTPCTLAEIKAKRAIKATGYQCKRCGGVAPVGVGYAVTGWRGVPDEARTACDCGHSLKATSEVHNPNPWVVVTNPGTDKEDIWADFPTHRAAVAALADAEEGADVMKRLDDGTLTTEF